MVNCEMCGKEGGLQSSDVEGVMMQLCPGCSKFGTAIIRKNLPPSKFRRKYVEKEQPDYRIVPNYSQLIRNVRQNMGLTQEDFSKFLNEKESLVAKWESGHMKPRIAAARNLERKLKIKLVILLESKKVETKSKVKNDEFTLGDFIKVRKNKR